MKIWVDGDSCHRLAMNTLLKAANEGRGRIFVVADRHIPAVAESSAELIIVGQVGRLPNVGVESAESCESPADNGFNGRESVDTSESCSGTAAPGLTAVTPHLTADEYIESHASGEDAVVTRDLELAMRLLNSGITVLNDRGRIWDSASLARRLEDSRMMLAMRKGGMAAPRKSSYTASDAGNFARTLDRLL